MRKAQFTKNLTITLSEEIFKRIKDETDAQGISISAWFRDAVIKKIEVNQTKNKEESK
jgi:hypothetical protein